MPGAISLEIQVRREAVQVGMAASGSERDGGTEHARTGNFSGVDGAAQGDIGVFVRADVADGGEAGEQRAARVNMRRGRDIDGGFAKDVFVIILRPAR